MKKFVMYFVFAAVATVGTFIGVTSVPVAAQSSSCCERACAGLKGDAFTQCYNACTHDRLGGPCSPQIEGGTVKKPKKP